MTVFITKARVNMKKRFLALTAVAGLTGAYLASISPRLKDRPDLSAFSGKVFAHRGMFGGRIVENSLAAFRKAVENRYGIELDVQVSADGIAMVVHDENLMRLYGENARVSALSAAELGEYGIPTLKEALEVIDGKVPLIVELKASGKDVSVAPIAAEILDEYNGEYCVESFNPMVLKWFRDCRPEVIRGQLATGMTKDGKITPKNFMLENLMFDFVSRPDFIAYNHNEAGRISVFLCRKLFGTPVFAWTVKTAEEWSRCADRFDSYICEGLPQKKKKQ